jgi:hypothetical protein
MQNKHGFIDDALSVKHGRKLCRNHHFSSVTQNVIPAPTLRCTPAAQVLLHEYNSYDLEP